MVERMLWVLALAGVVLLGYGFWRVYAVYLRPRLGRQAAGQLRLLYFTADYCAVCRGQQRPIIERLRSRWGDRLAIEVHDVGQHPALAQQYQVLTLPTTMVIGPAGDVLALNHGLADEGKLQTQLQRGSVPHPA